MKKSSQYSYLESKKKRKKIKQKICLNFRHSPFLKEKIYNLPGSFFYCCYLNFLRPKLNNFDNAHAHTRYKINIEKFISVSIFMKVNFYNLCEHILKDI